LEAWLNQVGDLRRKYGRTIEDVRDFGSRLEVRVGEIRVAIDRSVTIDRDIEESTTRLGRIAEELSLERRQAGARLVTEAIGHLADLGLGSAVLRLDWSTLDEPGPNGADAVSLLFASDDRLEPGSIGEVASGGELSRLVLALRLAGRDESSSTLVFDEVDAGIGGSTALALGEKIASLAETSQVIAVTHLPQVAAHASRHYVVDRSGETAIVHLVEGDERVTELTRMLSGLPGSEGGRDAVSELLAVVGAEAHPG
jgi:DNA repair protein RecN (Recombination protein N)